MYSVKINSKLSKEMCSRKVITFKSKAAAQNFIESKKKDAVVDYARKGRPMPRSYEVVATPEGVATYQWHCA
jgi:hypothetical protein